MDVDSVQAVAGKGLEGEPCRHLEKVTRPGIIEALAHRAGINADVLVGGVIRVGDPVVEL